MEQPSRDVVLTIIDFSLFVYVICVVKCTC